MSLLYQELLGYLFQFGAGLGGQGLQGRQSGEIYQHVRVSYGNLDRLVIQLAYGDVAGQ
jgi:hypothetical protein